MLTPTMIFNNSVPEKMARFEGRVGIAHDGKRAYAVVGSVVFGSIGSAFRHAAVVWPMR